MARVSFHVTFFKKSAGSRGKDLAKQGPCGSEDVPVTAGWAEAGQMSRSSWWPSSQCQAARLRPSPSPAPVGQHTPSRPARASSGRTPHGPGLQAQRPWLLSLCQRSTASIRAGKAALLVKTPPHPPPPQPCCSNGSVPVTRLITPCSVQPVV